MRLLNILFYTILYISCTSYPKQIKSDKVEKLGIKKIKNIKSITNPNLSENNKKNNCCIINGEYTSLALFMVFTLLFSIYHFFDYKENPNLELEEKDYFHKNDYRDEEHNKKIWIMWYQGWNHNSQIPYVVEKSLKSWEFYNEDDFWEIIKIDKNNIKDYLDDDFEIITKNLEPYTIQAFSDIIRINLLYKYGGVWVDSTAFCNKRLDEWITPYWKRNKFFAISNPDEKKLISSCFLVSKSNGTENYIINKLYNETMHFWFKDPENKNYTTIVNKDEIEYFWFHFLFNKLYENDKKFKSIWDNTLPKLEFKCQRPKPYFSGKYHDKISKEMIEIIDNKSYPIYKLTRKEKDPNTNKSETKYIYDYLFKTIENEENKFSKEGQKISYSC